MPGMTPGADGAPTPGGETEGSQRGNSDDDDGEGIDDDLAAELERGLEAVDQTDSDESEKGGDSDSDMGGLFGSNGGGSDVEDQLPGGVEGGDEDASTEQLEARRKARLLGDEIRDLEGAVNRKRTEVSNASNPIIKVSHASCLSFSSLHHMIASFRRLVAKAYYRARSQEGSTGVCSFRTRPRSRRRRRGRRASSS